MSKRVRIRVPADAHAAAGTDKSKEFAVSKVRLLGRLLDGGRAVMVEVSRSEVTPSLQQGAALAVVGRRAADAEARVVLAAPGLDLAGCGRSANGGPGAAEKPAGHFSRGRGPRGCARWPLRCCSCSRWRVAANGQ
jgi:hypothetical protein